MAEREENKSRHTGAKVAGAAVILALLGGGGYFGLGGGSGSGLFPGQQTEATAPYESGSAEEKSTEAEEISTEEITETEDDGVLEIVIKENGLSYEGRTVTLTELGEALLKDYHEGIKVTVKNDHAIKADYDEVIALLEKLKITGLEAE